MKKYLILSLLMLLAFSAKAQFTIGYSVGYGSYEMDAMKQVMGRMLGGLHAEYPTLPFKMVDDFPGYLTHNADVTYKMNEHEFGLRLSYLTTGGKISYADYSGEYMAKITLNGYRVAPVYRYNLALTPEKTKGSWVLYGELSGGIVYSEMKYKNEARMGDQYFTYSDQLSQNTTGFTVAPMVGAKFNLTRNIGLFAGCGYDFTFESNIEIGTGEQKMKIGNGIDWTGFRANGGVTYTFR